MFFAMGFCLGWLPFLQQLKLQLGERDGNAGIVFDFFDNLASVTEALLGLSIRDSIRGLKDANQEWFAFTLDTRARARS